MNLQTIQTVQEAIEKQLDILQKILSIEKEKHAVLLSGKLKDFSVINQSLLDKLEILEESELYRNHTLEKFIKENSDIFKEQQNINFQSILESIRSTPYFEDMESLYNRSRETVDKIKYYTNVNKDLIETALNVLSITLKQENKEIDFTKRTEVQGQSSLLLNKLI